MHLHRPIFVLTAGLLGLAGDPSEWEAVTNEYIERVESIADPKPIAYPEIAGRLRSLFRGPDPVRIRFFQERAGERRHTADAYYKPGELHLVQHVEGWNLVTKGSEAYEWKAGEKRGIITEVSDRDLVDYLLYVTDPSYIMTATYYRYLYDENAHTDAKESEFGCVELRFERPRDGSDALFVDALFVDEEPLWFCGFEMSSPATGETGRAFYSKPESIGEIPGHVLERIEGIDFRKSDASIRRHMAYL